MENLKKVITLHEASIISGYNQDYLSSLIRKNEIKGEKLGGSWFTTEEEVKNYIFKQKIKSKNWIVRYFLVFARGKSSFIYAFTFLAILSVGIYFYNKTHTEIQVQTRGAQFSDTNIPETKEKFAELNF